MKRKKIPGSACLAVAVAVVAVAAADGPVDLKGRVALSVGQARVGEGSMVAASTSLSGTATTERGARPESGLAMPVRVVSVDGSAAVPLDYEALDRTVTFRRSDFGREKRTVRGRRSGPAIGGRLRRVGPGVHSRWVARKLGTVTIIDGLDVEEDETFTLTASITSGAMGWVADPERVEVAIPDTDACGLEMVADLAEIAEGETRELALTVRVVLGDGSVPPARTCVMTIPVRLRLATGGGASPGADYTLHGLRDETRIPPCAPEVSWTVRLAAHVDSEDDSGETVTFTPIVDSDVWTEPALLAPAAVTIRESRKGLRTRPN